MSTIFLLSLCIFIVNTRAQFTLLTNGTLEPHWGEQGVFSPQNTPGARSFQVMAPANDNRHIWMGLGTRDNDVYFNDLWLFDTHTNMWAWVLGDNFTTIGSAEKNVTAAKSLNNPSARASSIFWFDNDNNIWIYGGYQGPFTNIWFFADLWKLTLSNLSAPYWTYVTGGNPLLPAKVYSNYGYAQGVPSSNIHPGSRAYGVGWTDDDNNLYMFGGSGFADSTTPDPGWLGDLWVFYKNSTFWAYLGGPRTVTDIFSDHIYGQKGVPNADNWPPKRVGSTIWKFIDTIYMFGGQVNYNENVGDVWTWENDIWTWISGDVTADDLQYIPGTCAKPTMWSDSNKVAGISQHTSWKRDNEIWIFAGNEYTPTGDIAMSNNIWIMNIDTLKWSCIEFSGNNVPLPRSNMPVVTINETVYFFGGYDVVQALSYGDMWSFNLNAYTIIDEPPPDAIVASSHKSSNSATIAIAVVIPVVVVLLAIGIFLFLWKRKKDNKPTENVELQSADNNNAYSSLSSRPSTVLLVKIEIETLLGAGNFGEVYKGKRNGEVVALKKLKSSDGWLEFQKEVNVLCSLKHKNIVSYLGIHKSPEGHCFIITELMSHGDLLRVLQSEAKTLTLLDILYMAQDAASGMSYIHSNNYIHRDLALRNLLATDGGTDNRKYTVKVSDFGMAKLLTDSNYYTSEGNHHPIKWCAVETLKFGKYSIQTDSWSFGILLWELFSLGASPYSGRTNLEVCDAVLGGYRLEKPELCPDEIYELMRQCWNASPKERPTMMQIEEKITSCIKSQ